MSNQYLSINVIQFIEQFSTDRRIAEGKYLCHEHHYIYIK